MTFVPLVWLEAASSGPPVTSFFAQDGDIAMEAGGGFEQPGAIAIPATGVGDPYPSTVSVNGLQGIVRDVVVMLDNLTHPHPEDLDVMLVSPTGRRALVMSDVGGDVGIEDVDLYLDDEAADPLPDGNIDSTPFEDSETYQPRNAGSGADEFPVPAPATTDASALSVFDGTDPNGTWRLFVVDDGAAVGPAAIADGWFLQVLTTSDPYPSTMDVRGVKGRIVDVNVDLTGFTHPSPSDVDMLLVGPHGQQATIISDNGGFEEVSNLNLTLDDEATQSLPDEFHGPIEPGVYRPGNQTYVQDDYWPPAPASTGKTALGAFDGTDPNGTWRLFIMDDNVCGVPGFCPDGSPWLPEEGYVGTLSGWRLQIRSADNAAPSGAVSVEGGAPSADAAAVTLALSATDPAPGEGVTRMRFSNDGSTFSLFRPYAATAEWTLAPGDGSRTVYAQFSDGAGNLSPVVSDTIVLAVGPRATRVKPSSRAKSVRTGATVKIFADEALAGRTVTKRHVRLTVKGSSRTIAAQVRYLAGKRVIRLDPKRPLVHDTTYKVTLTTRVTDLAGNRWDQKTAKAGDQRLAWTFRTR